MNINDAIKAVLKIPAIQNGDIDVADLPDKIAGAKDLLKLADYLDTKVPSKQFDMGYFCRNENECGFSGCAMGWAGTMPYSRQKGLSSDHKTGLVTYTKNLVKYVNFNAAEKLFNITGHDSTILFTGDGTPKQVAKRIRKFVRENYGNIE